MRIFDARWQGMFGIGRVSSELRSRLVGFVGADLGGNPYAATDSLRLTYYLRHKRPNLFFSPGYNAPLGKPCEFALTVHDLNHISVPRNKTALKSLYYNVVLRPAVRNARLVFTVSDFSRQQILQWSNVDADKVVAIRPGVARVFEPTGQASIRTRPYFLYVGNGRPHKNLRRVLIAFAASRLDRDCDLIVIGLTRRQGLELARTLKVERGVLFLGRVSDEDLAALYRGALGLVFVSLYEGFGLPIVEAMACGTPVLTSNTASMPEVAGDAALLVDPLRIEEIAAGMRRLIEDDSTRKDIVLRGLRRAALFNWDCAAQVIQKKLDEVTDSN